MEQAIWLSAVRLCRTPLSLLAAMCLVACTGVPENIQPVENFELRRYLGKWYEIARLDHSFERGLSRVTADYSLNEDGTVRVLNSGYSAAQQKWKRATGRARFAAEKTTGHLEVSFFGPFYSSYVIIALDRHYRHALVTGYNRSYLWILSREPCMPEPVLQQLVTQARSLGYATDALVFVDQGCY
ncbi:lipocalin family protein [Microbulbifer sp. 2201CG32-9]|uniref:lipocalin family protein n=1 Tax=Microbulbifer sp. 2201CG32-9 TaxID=3232309 RepID=UPI00345C2E69